MRLNVSSAKWRPFCLGLHVLTQALQLWISPEDQFALRNCHETSGSGVFSGNHPLWYPSFYVNMSDQSRISFVFSALDSFMVIPNTYVGERWDINSLGAVRCDNNLKLVLFKLIRNVQYSRWNCASLTDYYRCHTTVISYPGDRLAMGRENPRFIQSIRQYIKLFLMISHQGTIFFNRFHPQKSYNNAKKFRVYSYNDVYWSPYGNCRKLTTMKITFFGY